MYADSTPPAKVAANVAANSSFCVIKISTVVMTKTKIDRGRNLDIQAPVKLTKANHIAKDSHKIIYGTTLKTFTPSFW